MDKNKMKDSAESAGAVAYVFLLVFMFCLPFVLIIVTLINLIAGKFAAAGFTAVLAAAALAGLAALIRIDDKRSAKKKQLYTEQYVTEFKVNDPDFGELTFEHDSKTSELSLIHGVPALIGGGELEIVAEDDGEKDSTPILECLRRVMRDKDKIIKGMFGTVRDVYEDESITEDDEEGVPTDDDYIMKHLYIRCVYCAGEEEGGISFTVTGGMSCDIVDHIGEHGLTAEYDPEKDDYDFYSG